MRRESQVIALIFLAWWGLSGCGGKQMQGQALNPDFKSYFDYQKGSYWIFYDSLNGHQDTFNATAYADYPSGTLKDEQVDIGMERRFPTYENWVIGLAGTYGAGIDFNRGYDVATDVLVSMMPFLLGNKRNKDGTVYSTTSLLPSKIINNVSYNNVYEIIIIGSIYSTNGGRDTVYLNRDSGLLAVLLHNNFFQERQFIISSSVIR